MKKYITAILLVLPMVALAKGATGDASGEVYKVTDGDTLKIEATDGKDYTLRVLGLDTPEKYPTRYGYTECFGEESSAYAKTILDQYSSNVYVEFYGDDKYNRDLAEVYLGSYTGKLFAEKMIKDGYGFVYRKGIKTKNYSKLVLAENFAKKKKLGLWNPKTCNGKRTQASTGSTVKTSTGTVSNPVITPIIPATSQQFSCSNVPRVCADVKSREEAQFYLNSCGAKKFDSDKDGIACESIK